MHFSLIPSCIILHSCVPTCLSFYYNPFENRSRSASETELLLDEKTIIVVVVVVVVALRAQVSPPRNQGGEEALLPRLVSLLRARRVVGIVLKASPRSNGGPNGVCAVACHVPALSACQRSASTNPRRSSNLDWPLRRRRILQPRSLRLRRVCVAVLPALVPVCRWPT